MCVISDIDGIRRDFFLSLKFLIPQLFMSGAVNVSTPFIQHLSHWQYANTEFGIQICKYDAKRIIEFFKDEENS